MGQGVKLNTMAERMELKNLTPMVDLVNKEISVPDINRPALQLTGYFAHFDEERVQIIGYVEFTYLEQLEKERKLQIYNQLLSHKIPCIIFSRELQPDVELLEMATERDIPVLQTTAVTSAFTAELIRWLSSKLAPCI